MWLDCNDTFYLDRLDDLHVSRHRVAATAVVFNYSDGKTEMLLFRVVVESETPIRRVGMPIPAV